MNNFHRIIWYHKCVCGIFLRKLKKYSKYTMKTCQENLWHIYMMGYFNLVIGWRMQGWLKGQSYILKTAKMVPRKRLSRAIPLHSDPAGDGRCAPVGPECKNSEKHVLWAQRSFQNHHQTFHDRCPEKIGPLPKKSDHWFTRTCPKNMGLAPTWSKFVMFSPAFM